MTKVLASLCAMLLGGCNSHYYHEQAKSYIPGIHKILVSKGLCESEPSCKLAFISGGAWVVGSNPYGGVNVSIYEQKDTAIVSELLAFCVANQRLHSTVKTTVRIFSSAHLAEQEVLVAELELPAQG